MQSEPERGRDHHLGAVRASRKGLELMPGNDIGVNSLAMSLLSLGQMQYALDEIPEGIASAREALELAPENPRIPRLLSSLLIRDPERTGESVAEAVAMARRAVELSPRDPEAPRAAYLHTLARALLFAGELEESLRILRGSIADHGGGDASDWILMAVILWHRGEKEEAREWLAKADRFYAEEPTVSRWAKENYEEAKKLLSGEGEPREQIRK
jgi:tetratricopeptide (TPR) repeat protein